VCYARFCDISGGSDPDLDGLDVEQICRIANDFEIPIDCFTAGGNDVYANSLCVAIHEAYHEMRFRYHMDVEMNNVCCDPCMDPIPVHCGYNGCRSSEADSRKITIRSKISEALQLAIEAFTAEGNIGADAAAAQCDVDTGVSIANQWCQ
jgi:hypothetical protein